jgi:HSP20 family protein
MARLQNEVNRLFGESFGSSASARTPNEELAQGVWHPAVDVTEDQEKIVLAADLPGLGEKDVDIQVERDTLTIRGERKVERKTGEKDHYYRYERVAGTFVRSFALPTTVDVEKISATMKDGVLTLTLPKRVEAQPRQIRVKPTS